MGTYLYFDNSELWEHIQSELWHLSFGIMGSFRLAQLIQNSLVLYRKSCFHAHSDELLGPWT
jgi:hypothetical protein